MFPHRKNFNLKRQTKGTMAETDLSKEGTKWPRICELLSIR